MSSIAWDTETPEWFNLMRFVWDVREAKRILSKKKRVRINRISTDGLRGISTMFSVTAPSDRPIDLSVPLIMIKIPVKGAGHLPIDGWHRIRYAINSGISELPFVMLTAAEEKRIRVRG